MQLSVTFRHMDPSDALKAYAEEKISRIEKYVDTALEAHVVLSVEKFRHTADVTVAAEGITLKGQEQTEDMYSAIDMVLDKMERQVKRYRDKSKGRHAGSKARPNTMRTGELLQDKAVTPDKTEDRVEEEMQELLILSQPIETKPMDVEEAVARLDLSQDRFMVFTNAATEEVNVVYRRSDGNYGLVEPHVD